MPGITVQWAPQMRSVSSINWIKVSSLSLWCFSITKIRYLRNHQEYPNMFICLKCWIYRLLQVDYMQSRIRQSKYSCVWSYAYCKCFSLSVFRRALPLSVVVLHNFAFRTLFPELHLVLLAFLIQLFSPLTGYSELVTNFGS